MVFAPVRQTRRPGPAGPAVSHPVCTEPRLGDEWIERTWPEIQGWRDDNVGETLPPFLRAIHALEASAWRTSSFCETHQAALTSAARHGVSLVDQAQGQPSDATVRKFYEAWFAPVQRRDASGQGLLTGYYAPIIDGALEPSDAFSVPLYRFPPELSEKSGTTADHPTRAEIDAGALAGRGLELCWLTDPIDAFFLHVQGSGIVRLPSGTFFPVTFAGKTGHPYTSIGRKLVMDGVFTTDDMSLQTLEAWLRADDVRGRQLMACNVSYVFFEQGRTGVAAIGALGTDLTAGRSLAVDPDYHPLGLPIFLAADGVVDEQSGRNAKGLRRLMIAEDVGGAIKGAERGDIYWGAGEVAKARAGTTLHPCGFTVLVPRVAPHPETV